MAQMTKKALFNAKNNGVKIEDGLHIQCVCVGTFEDTDKDGNDVTVTALQDVDGTVYTSISATVAGSVDLLDEILDEEGQVEVVVHSNVSSNGRTFLTLSIQ